MTSEEVAHFEECYDAFAARERAIETFSDWTKAKFHDAVTTKLAFDGLNKDETNCSKQFRVLGIGSGSGEVDYMFLEQLVKKYSNISHISLERSDENIALFKSLVARGTIKGVTWEWKQIMWDHYWFGMVKSKDPRKFHFIHTVHNLIYIKDVAAAIMNMYELLAEGGVLLMIVVSEQSGTYNLRKKFPDLVDKDGLSNVSSAEIIEILQTHDIPFERIKQQSRVDITTCFQKGRKEGALLIDHLSRTMNFLKTASPRLVNDFMGYLKGPDCVEKEQQNILFVNDWEAIIVTK